MKNWLFMITLLLPLKAAFAVFLENVKASLSQSIVESASTYSFFAKDPSFLQFLKEYHKSEMKKKKKAKASTINSMSKFITIEALYFDTRWQPIKTFFSTTF